jgi:hypothetical protein
MVKGFIHGKMEVFTTGSGKTIKDKEKEKNNGTMVNNMKVIGIRTKEKARAYSIGQMGITMKANGLLI